MGHGEKCSVAVLKKIKPRSGDSNIDLKAEATNRPRENFQESTTRFSDEMK